ncbi:MAG: hypothetical protein D6824_08170, partial [Planctomycetota bacterium]
MTRSGDTSIAGEAVAVESTSLDAVARPRRMSAPSAEKGQAPLLRPGDIRAGKLAGLSMRRAIWTLSWPVLGESLLDSLVGIVDTTLAAGLSTAAADAIGAASYIAWALALIGLSLGTGATALVARSVGKGRRAVADAVVGQTVAAALVLGAVVGLAVALLAGPLAVALQLSPAAAEALTLYLRIIALGVPAISLIKAAVACQRGAGDAKRPLAVMIAVNALNIPLSWALSGVDLGTLARSETGELVRVVALANPFPFDMGIAGIAWGTVIAQTLGACVVLTMLARGSSGVALKRRRLAPHRVTLVRLARLGFPNFLESAGMWAGNFLVLLLVGALGAEGLY